MGQYVAFDTESGSILVEASAPGAGAVTRSGSDRLAVESATRLVDVIGALRPAAEALVDSFRTMRNPPMSSPSRSTSRSPRRASWSSWRRSRGQLRRFVALEPAELPPTRDAMTASSRYRHDELRVRFEHGPHSTYRVNVRGRGGDASGPFEPPFSDDELESFVETAGRARRQARRLDSRAMEKAKSYGDRLFDALFHHDTRDLFRRSLGLAEESQLGVRITVELSGTPELCNIQWEYLFDSPNFLAASVWTPIVRYLDLPGSRRPLAVSPPLKILGVISSPVNVSYLDVDEERTRLERALSRSVGAGEVTVTWTDDATLDGLRRALRDDDYHVLHFIGHGGFIERGQEGVLLFENARRGSAEISG